MTESPAPRLMEEPDHWMDRYTRMDLVRMSRTVDVPPDDDAVIAVIVDGCARLAAQRGAGFLGGRASLPGGAGAATARPRPCGRRGRAAGSTGAPPPDGPPGAAAPPPAPPAPASSCWEPTGPRRAAPPPCAAPGRAAGPGLRRCAGSRAGPMTDCAPAGGRSPRSKARFPSGRGSGISRYGSGGAGPRAWRPPSRNEGTVAAIRPIRNIMRRYDHHSPT